ncbi:MAG TPA: TonB-dependent receptor [Terriglobia bacterium]|nr:TonB-dependent receptor [Terriglobia bacterium]
MSDSGFHKTLRFFLPLVALALLSAVTARSQSTGGASLAGHVSGPGGVAVPGATVVVTDTANGVRKETWTDEAGNYAVRGLEAGSYQVEVSLVGFRPSAQPPVAVASGQPSTVNLALSLASLAPAAEENAATPAAKQSLRGARANNAAGRPDWNSLPPEVIERLRKLAEQRVAQGAGGAGREGMDRAAGLDGLPEPGSGATGAAAVRFSDSADSAGGAASQGAGTEDSSAGSDMGGAQSSANSFLLSGSVGQAPTPEGDRRNFRQRIQEFRQAQQGAPGFGGGGGFEGAVIFFGGRFGGRRPQVNRLRGNLYERYSNSAFDASPYPLNVPESHQIASYQEQFGASVGGPLVIPKIYNGSKNTSFFVHYNLQRSKSPFDSFATVPTLLERGGDFSQTVIASGPLAGMVPVIYDPQSNPLGPRTPFAGNVIPAARLNSAAIGLLPFIPLPNVASGAGVQNFHLQEALPSANDRVMGRIGHQISSKDSLSAFYFFNSSRSNSVLNFPALKTSTSVRSQNLNLSENHTFSSQVVNNFLLNFNRQRVQTLNPFAFTQNVAGDLGITGISQNPRDFGLPAIDFTNFAAVNDTIPNLTRNQTTRAFDFVIVNKDKHNLRFGGELRRVNVNTLTDPDARGTFTFSGFTTSNFTAAGQPVAGTGFDFADFLLGLPQATSVRFGTSSNYFRSWVYSGFVQDDWRAGARLTFSLGLRYEHFQPFAEKYGHLSDLAVGPGFATLGVVTGQNPGALPDSLIRSDANNLAPRLGVAFRPWTKRQLVLRAGYGIFYDSSIYQRLVPNLANQPPFAQASTLLTTPAQVLTLQDGFPQIASGVARNTYAVDPNFRTPYGQTWNFSLEDEIAPNWVLSVGYVGTRGSHLDLLLGPNPAASTGTAGSAGSGALQYTYETSGAASLYNGLQVSLRRNFHNGLSLWSQYTFSKSIDNASSVGGAGSVVAQDFQDLEAERGLSVFDVRHRLLVNYNYELPFGGRKRYLSHGGALGRVLGDWQISGVTTIQSGTPYTARLLGNLSNNGGTGAYFSERGQATGQAVLPAGFNPTPLQFFNMAAFTLPPPGQLGNAGRNTIPGPHTTNFNMSLDREIVLSPEKGVRGDFRIEAANVFNTPNFTGLATVVNATDFGRVTSVANMRTVALSLRLRF